MCRIIRIFAVVSVIFSSILLLLYILVQKYQLGLVRYFDMDEFAYLNWTSHMVKGSLPYRDFLYQLPPGYLLLLSPIAWISHTSLALLTNARVVAWGIYVALVVVTGMMFYLVRKSWIAIIASLFLAFLPLPSDKFLEVRPDTIGVLCAMMGSVFQILWMERYTKKYTYLFMSLSGIFYGLSVFMLQKTIPHVVIATFIAFIWIYKEKKISPLPYIFSGGILFLLFGIWAVSHGIGPLVWYLLMKFPQETIPMARDFAIPPWFFFRYTDIYYGMYGWNWGYIINQLLWVSGICMGIVRLVSPFATRGKQEGYSEFLLASIFIAQLFLFVYYMPFKHSQYLIPLAVFVAFYSADIVNELWIWGQQFQVGKYIVSLGLLILIYGCYIGFQQVNTPKFNWTSDRDKQMITYMHTVIPEGAYVFDLVGVSLSYPQPYYVSCLPVGQFAKYLSVQLPSLAQALERTKTRFIYQGSAKRVTTLTSEDQQYVHNHFVPIGDGTLLERVN